MKKSKEIRSATQTPAEDKRFLSRIRALCLELPETKEVEAWGHPTFRAGKKMFAAYGFDKYEGNTLGLKVGLKRQQALLKDRRFFPTPYAAHQGWVSLRLGKNINWEEVGSLIKDAYRQVALKRMITALESS